MEEKPVPSPKTAPAAPPAKRSLARRVLSGAGWLLHALVFPYGRRTRGAGGASSWSVFDWRKMAVYAAAWCGIFPLGVTLFPNAAGVLRREGLDPALVQQLAPGKTVHILEDTPAGTAATLMQTVQGGPLFLVSGTERNTISYYFSEAAGVGALTRRDLTVFGKPVLPGTCAVYLKPRQVRSAEAETARDVALAGGGTYSYAPVPPETLRKFVTLHEIRHCSDDQRPMAQWSREADSDWHAYAALEGMLDGKTRLKLRRAINLAFEDPDHNTALYVDAEIESRPVPSPEEAAQANRLADPAIRLAIKDLLLDMEGQKLGAEKTPPAEACRVETPPAGSPENKSCAGLQKLELPPLARHRLQLFLDAQADEFVPAGKKPAAASSLKPGA